MPRLHHKSARPRLLHQTFDNYVTNHGRPWVPAWIRQRPPAAFHFIPTGSRRLDPIQRWLVELQKIAVRPGVFRSVDELKIAIDEVLAASKHEPVAYTWAAGVEPTLAKIYSAVCDPIHPAGLRSAKPSDRSLNDT